MFNANVIALQPRRVNRLGRQTFVPSYCIDEAPGQVAAYEANYRVGAPVVHELVGNWSRYQNAVPQAEFE